MYCSTCGALIPAGRTGCSECGTPVAAAVARAAKYGTVASTGQGRVAAESAAAICPRCGYHGEGLPYFSRGSHVAFLVGLVVLTAGLMGAGGLAYYLLRRDHRVCPRCGLGWGKDGERVHSAALGTGAAGGPAPEFPSFRRESRLRGASILLMLLAAILVLAGVLNFEAAPALLGAAVGGGAWMLNRSARAAREARRAALLGSLQLPVLKLAEQRGGRLTVTEVAAQLGWTLPRAEKVLQSMDDGYRVSSEVTDEGVIVYEFLELVHLPERLPPATE